MSTLLDRILRRPTADLESPMNPEPTVAETPVASPLTRFLTQGGAEVHITGSGSYGAKDNHWVCLGCNDRNDSHFGLWDWQARKEANDHASACRAMPKPTA